MARTRSAYARCKWCGSRTFSWGHPTGGGWALYNTLRDANGQDIIGADGKAQPDKNARHLCPSRPKFGAPGTAAVPGETQQTPEPEEITPEPEETATEPQASEPNATDGLAQAIARAVGPLVAGKIDAQAVRAIVKAETDAIRAELAAVTREEPRTVRLEMGALSVETAPGDHKQLSHLIALAALAPTVKRWPFLWGPAGGGKSTAAERLATLLGREFYYKPLGPSTLSSEIIGYRLPTGEVARTVTREAVENGGVLCFDEADNTSDAVMTMLNGALASGLWSFPDKMIRQHPDCLIVLTGNTPLRGGTRGHSGRRALDAATIDRLAYVNWSYDEQQERSRVRTVLNGKTDLLMDWIVKVRAHCNAHRPDLIVSQRASFALAAAIASGTHEAMGVDAVLDAYLWNGIEPQACKQILATVGECPAGLWK